VLKLEIMTKVEKPLNQEEITRRESELICEDLKKINEIVVEVATKHLESEGGKSQGTSQPEVDES
jgi:hypothetical protein